MGFLKASSILIWQFESQYMFFLSFFFMKSSFYHINSLSYVYFSVIYTNVAVFQCFGMFCTIYFWLSFCYIFKLQILLFIPFPFFTLQIQNGASFVIVDKISNPRDGSPALLIQGAWTYQS